MRSRRIYGTRVQVNGVGTHFSAHRRGLSGVEHARAGLIVIRAGPRGSTESEIASFRWARQPPVRAAGSQYERTIRGARLRVTSAPNPTGWRAHDGPPTPTHSRTASTDDTVRLRIGFTLGVTYEGSRPWRQGELGLPCRRRCSARPFVDDAVFPHEGHPSIDAMWGSRRRDRPEIGQLINRPGRLGSG
jgi:hypothetical protein